MFALLKQPYQGPFSLFTEASREAGKILLGLRFGRREKTPDFGPFLKSILTNFKVFHLLRGGNVLNSCPNS